MDNTKQYRWGRSLPCFPAIVIRLKGILERFLNAAGCINAGFVSDETLEKLPEPAQIGQTRVGGIDLNQPRIRRVAEAVLALSASPGGFTASDLAQQVRSMSGQPETEYGARGEPAFAFKASWTQARKRSSWASRSSDSTVP